MADELKFMSVDRQQQIVEAVKTAVDYHLVEELPADTAVAKAASDNGASEHEVRLMCEAFNTSKTLAHLRDSEGEAKTASFELADVDKVLDVLYPQQQPKVAGSRLPELSLQTLPNYHRQPVSPPMEKAASADEQPARLSSPRREFDLIDRHRKVAVAAENKALYFEQSLHQLCDDIATHFKQAGALHGWPTFVAEAQQLHGQLGADLATAIGQSHGLEALQAKHGKQAAARTLADPESELHQLFDTALKCAHAAAEERVNQQEAVAQQVAERQQWDDRQKQASLAGIATLGVLNRSINDLWSTPQKQPDVNIDTDVGLESEYGRTRLQLALRDMLEDDEVLAEHAGSDPDRIAQAAQELAQTAPNILNQPMLLRQALRRHLELGVTEPHELQQVQQVAGPERQQALMNPGAI